MSAILPLPEPIAQVAAGWHCRCTSNCDALSAAQCLHRATLDLLGSDSTADQGYRLLGPLAAVVSRQRGHGGHAECRRFAEALARGDRAAAVFSCQQLVQMATPASGAST